MKKLLQDLIKEIAELMPELVENREYLSVREYSHFLTKLMLSFSEYLLSDRKELNTQERILLEEMIHNPLVKALNVRAAIDRELERSYCGSP